MSKVSVTEKFSAFNEHWSPKIIAQSNGQLIKLAKGCGELVWHKHDHEDELFLVFKGELTIMLRNENVVLGPGDMYVVPKGIEHCPRATEETHIMLIEPASTKHTGEEQTELTVAVEEQEWI